MAVFDSGPLTAEDRTTVDYLSSTVTERLASSRPNSWVEVRLDKRIRPAIIATVKGRVESAGRQVGVFEDPLHWRLTFPPPVAALPALSQITAMAPISPVALADSVATPRVLVRMPTRDRPAQALHALAAYRSMAGLPVALEVVVDCDDRKMLSSEVLQRLCALDAVVTVGQHRSKVEAVNGGRVENWDILILASDDMIPIADGYARVVAEQMEERFPHLDGLIYFDDGYAGERCCTLPIFGRRLYDQFGYVYEPRYRSLCCDVEQTELLRAMGRASYVDKMIIEHRHPAAGKAASDALYGRNDALHDADRLVYEQRKTTRRPHAQFAFDSPPIALSICVATVPERHRQLARLVTYLHEQIRRCAARKVEIVIDNESGDIGAKRQRLIEKARGHYVAHVDDDDWVSFDYVQRIVGAIESSDYAVDCVALSGLMTTNGGSESSFHHSVQYREWFTDSAGVHYRSPNHLNPVRRELALEAGFPAKIYHGEDHEFSRRLLPLIKSETSAGSDPLYHYWFYKPESK